MRAGMWVALAAVVAVAGCGTVRDSRLNPVNWFGGSSARVVSTDPQVIADEGRMLVAEVTELHVERTKGGAIIRAVGVPGTQGWYDALLVRQPSAANELSYRFVLMPPKDKVQRTGIPRSREVTVATFVNDYALSGITEVTVSGERNARSTRRR